MPPPSHCRCGATFRRPQELKRHQDTAMRCPFNHNPAGFQCYFCERLFPRKDLQKRHMHNKHRHIRIPDQPGPSERRPPRLGTLRPRPPEPESPSPRPTEQAPPGLEPLTLGPHGLGLSWDDNAFLLPSCRDTIERWRCGVPRDDARAEVRATPAVTATTVATMRKTKSIGQSSTNVDAANEHDPLTLSSQSWATAAAAAVAGASARADIVWPGSSSRWKEDSQKVEFLLSRLLVSFDSHLSIDNNNLEKS